MKVLSFFLLIIAGLNLLNSCSSDKTEKKTEPIITSEEVIVSNKETTIIDKNLVLNWDYTRQNLDSVNKIFNSNGNKFSFIKDSTNQNHVIHAYIGLNKKHQLNFTLIKSKNDTIKNSTCMLFSTLDSLKFELPVIDSIHKNYDDTIARKEAGLRIQNWINDTIRNEWINQFENETDSIFQLFRINTVDFEYGVMHDCYLALRQDSSSYTADLIIVNREHNKVVTTINNGNVEDLTQPIPPLGNHNSDKYGLLKWINKQQYQP